MHTIDRVHLRDHVSSPARIDANLRLPDGFVLSDSEMEELFGLDEGGGAWQQIH